MLRSISIAFATSFLVITGDVAAQSSIVGTWEMTSGSPMGEMKSTLVFTDEDDILTGTIENQFVGLQEFARVSDNAGLVSLQLDLVGANGPITMVYEGFLEEGYLSGTVTGPGTESDTTVEEEMELTAELGTGTEPDNQSARASEFTAVRVLLEESEEEE